MSESLRPTGSPCGSAALPLFEGAEPVIAKASKRKGGVARLQAMVLASGSGGALAVSLGWPPRPESGGEEDG